MLAEVDTEVDRFVSLTNARFAQLEEQLCSTNSTAASTNDRFEAIEKAMSAMQRAMSSLQNDNATLHEDIAALRENNDSLQKNVESLTKKICKLSKHSLVYYSSLASEILTRFAKGSQPDASNTRLFQNLSEDRKSLLRKALSEKGEDLESFIFKAEALVNGRNTCLHFVDDLDTRVEEALEEEGVFYHASDREYEFAHWVFLFYEDIKRILHSNCIDS